MIRTALLKGARHSGAKSALKTLGKTTKAGARVLSNASMQSAAKAQQMRALSIRAASVGVLSAGSPLLQACIEALANAGVGEEEDEDSPHGRRKRSSVKLK